jgi:hypothetical protein
LGEDESGSGKDEGALRGDEGGLGEDARVLRGDEGVLARQEASFSGDEIEIAGQEASFSEEEIGLAEDEGGPIEDAIGSAEEGSVLAEDDDSGARAAKPLACGGVGDRRGSRRRRIKYRLRVVPRLWLLSSAAVHASAWARCLEAHDGLPQVAASVTGGADRARAPPSSRG